MSIKRKGIMCDEEVTDELFSDTDNQVFKITEEMEIIVTDPSKVVEKSIKNHEILSSLDVVPE